MHQRFLIPVPKEIRFLSGIHLLNPDSLFRAPESCKKQVLGLAEKYWNIHPRFQAAPPRRAEENAFSLRIDEKEIFLDAANAGEVLHLFKTMRQMAEPERGKAASGRFILPCAEVKDEPGLPFRGIHFCYFAETEEFQLEKMIRLAAFCKFNYAVIEFWGTFPFEKHPEFQWESKRGNRPFLEHLIALGHELGITLIPQLNLLGHAPGASIVTGKHVVLDRYPQYGPLFEPDGWTWCLSNPEVRRIQAELLEEMLAAFGPVPYFHLGFDEAFNAATCTECAKHSFQDLLLDHILFLHGLLARHHVRPILWHDMFLELDKAKWDDNIIEDRNRPNPYEILEKLPRDILLADWHYNAPPESGPLWPTADHFASKGFSVLLCPWTNQKGILTMAEKAAESHLEGVLQTTWSAVSGTGTFRKYFCVSANKMWNRAWTPETGFADEMQAVNRLLRFVVQDMALTGYESSGTVSHFAI